MPWETSLTTDDITEQMIPDEVTALQTIQGADTQLQACLTKAIASARSKIKAGGNQVDQTSTTTLPDSVVQDVVDITRWKWLSSFPALQAFKTKDRSDAYKDAMAHLRDIASQKPDRERVELPANVDTTPAAVPLPSVGCPKRRMREDGIV